MIKLTRNKLSAAAWGVSAFCAFWLLLSAHAAVRHDIECRPVSRSHTGEAYISSHP